MYHQRTERPASDRAFAGGATWTLSAPVLSRQQSTQVRHGDRTSRPSAAAALAGHREILRLARHVAGQVVYTSSATAGAEFDCGGFRDWCSRKGIKPRYGAVGKHGSIAVVERLILTLKTLLGCMLLVPYRREAFKRELDLALGWYNHHRPAHPGLAGKTPNEVYYAEYSANRKPRYEPRSKWPRGSPCAAPLGTRPRKSRRTD